MESTDVTIEYGNVPIKGASKKDGNDDKNTMRQEQYHRRQRYPRQSTSGDYERDNAIRRCSDSKEPGRARDDGIRGKLIN